MFSVEVLNWFAAGATIIGSVASVLKPDNAACPLSLSPVERTAVVAVLGVAQMFLMSLYSGASIQAAILTAISSVVSVLALHGTDPVKVTQ